MKPLFAFVIGLALVATSGCQSPPEACPECASSAATSVSNPSPFVSEWSPVAQRSPAPGDIEFTAQDGRRLRFGDLKGAPLALSFIYTRCQNARKCPLVARTMAQLQTEIERANLQPPPTLALVTYDPEYDTPSRLDAFGRQFGFVSTKSTLLLRPDPALKTSLFDRLNVAVNFNTDGVNLHGIQLLLFDKNARLARTYHGLIWSNAQVLADLKSLAAEPRATPIAKN